MELHGLMSLLVMISALLSTSRSLDHEKSFLVQDGASYVYAIAIYKGSLLLTSSNDIVQKDIETGVVQRTFRAHTNQVWSFVLMNDSRMISSGWDDMVYLWDLETGSIQKKIWLGSSNTQVQGVSYQGSQAFVGGLDRKVRFINLETGRITRTITLVSGLFCVVSDEDYVYVSGSTSTEQVLRLRASNGQIDRYYVGQSAIVTALTLAGGYLFSGAGDGLIIFWNPSDGVIINTLNGHADFVYAFALHENYLYSGDKSRVINKWNIGNGQLVKRFPQPHSNAVRCMAYLNNFLFTGSEDNTVVRWNLTDNTRYFTYKGNSKILRGIVSWGKFIISGGDDAVIRMWDASVNSINPFASLYGHRVFVLSLHVINDFMYSGSSDTEVREWDLVQHTTTKILKGHTGSVTEISSYNSLLYSGSHDSLIIQWNVTLGSAVNVFTKHFGAVVSIQFLEDFMLSASYDQNIHKWNIETRDTVQTIFTAQSLNKICIVEDSLIAGGGGFLQRFSMLTGENFVNLQISAPCFALVSLDIRIFSGHLDGLIRVRDLFTLDVLETYQGHSDSVWELSFDNSKVLFSASGDGSVKKWNVASRKVAYSFENRNSSVRCLAAIGSNLFVGTNNGALTSYKIDSGFVKIISSTHKNVVSSIIISNNFIFSSGLDGFIKRASLSNFGAENLVLYNADKSPVKSLVSSTRGFYALSGDLDIIEVALNSSSESLRRVSSSEPLTALAYADSLIFASAKSGVIIAWDTQTLAKRFELKGHTSQINAMLVKDNVLYSASDDKTIIMWSLLEKEIIRTLKRTSASALGHLGSVNSITLCNGVLFSGGSDVTTRRWDTKTGRHEDVYFGFTKSVTAVHCYNGTVFSGSEDFAVLMYKPQLPEEEKFLTSINTKTASKSKLVKIVRNTRNAGLSASQNQEMLIVIIAVAAFILAIAALAISCYKYKITTTPTILSSTGFVSSYTATETDLQTVINTVMGISKHAAYLIPHGAFAKVKKLASGGGGELFISKIMDQRFIEVSSGIVIQKIVYTSTKSVEESFFQEVGIMIMLKDFPHFCHILGYTEKPLSIVMKYYPDGSLFEWLRRHKYSNRTTVRVLREVSTALSIMHSYHLAHCDIKTQNVLVEVVKGIPHCYLTDFGITRILSDKILASQLFSVINLRGLSTQYASPEAFENFQTKSYVNTDFKKYDIYSFACTIYELLVKRTPWARE